METVYGHHLVSIEDRNRTETPLVRYVRYLTLKLSGSLAKGTGQDRTGQDRTGLDGTERPVHAGKKLRPEMHRHCNRNAWPAR